MELEKTLTHFTSIFLVLLMVASLFMTGCSKQAKTTVTNFQITAEEIVKLMEANEINPLLGYAVADGVFSTPSELWIATDFSSDLKNFQFYLKDSQWVAEENDCDDFARGAAFFAQLLHHNTRNKIQQTALAFGEFWYKQQNVGYHAIDFAVVRDQQLKLKVVFYEPQLKQIITLTRAEKLSCLHWRL